MRITQSTVNLQGRSETVQQHAVTESLRQWRDGQPPQQGTGKALPGSIRMALSSLGFQKLKDEWTEKAKADLAAGVSAADGVDAADDQFALTDKDMAKITLIEDFVYYMTGKRIKIQVPKQVNQEQAQAAQAAQTQAMQNGAGPRRLGWGIDYQYHESTYEREAVSFTSNGSVTTEDGRTIDFSLQFTMSREFASETHVSIKAGDALVDPLVINLSGAAATLGERTFRFDLDTDGTQDTISFLGEGSGFLTLDRNGNGLVDDGGELFGPQTGNGFDELAVLDGDQNGWIDENDAVFDKLRIWSMDGAGNLQLEALGKAGVGAIYLGNVTTPYRLLGVDGQTNGQIARSGVYLHEDGTAGTVQHVDLSV